MTQGPPCTERGAHAPLPLPPLGPLCTKMKEYEQCTPLTQGPPCTEGRTCPSAPLPPLCTREKEYEQCNSPGETEKGPARKPAQRALPLAPGSPGCTAPHCSAKALGCTGLLVVSSAARSSPPPGGGGSPFGRGVEGGGPHKISEPERDTPAGTPAGAPSKKAPEGHFNPIDFNGESVFP